MSTRLRALFAGKLFRQLLGARALSQLGDGLFQISAASVLLFEDPGPNPVLDLLAVTAITLIPFSALGPFAGVFIDRWDRHRILTVVPLVRALAAIGVAVATERSVAFYTLVLIVLSANRFFLATVSAELPRAVADVEHDLLTANAVQTTGGSISNVAGQGIGSLIAGAIGGVRTTLVASAAFGAVAMIARGVPMHRGHPTGPAASLRAEVARVSRELAEGARAVWRNTRVRRALTAILIAQTATGVMVGVLIHYFIAVLHLDVDQAFAILAFLAVGIGVGVLAVPVIARRLPTDAMIGLSFALSAVTCAMTAAALSRAMLVVAATAVGISYALVKIPVDTIVQEEVSDAIRGRAFALYDVLFNLARVIGVGVAAIAFEVRPSAAPVVAWTGVAYALTGVWLALWGRRLRSSYQ